MTDARKLARATGLAPDLIDAIAARREPQAMPADESAVYAFCRDAHDTGRVSDPAFDAIRKRFGLESALEFLALSGLSWLKGGHSTSEA